MFHHAGGVAGLVVCLFAKYNKWWLDRQQGNEVKVEVYEVHKWWRCRKRSGEAQVGSAQSETLAHQCWFLRWAMIAVCVL